MSELGDGAGQAVEVADGPHQRRVPVERVVAGAAVVGGDEGGAAGHGLHRGEAEPLDVAGLEERPGPGRRPRRRGARWSSPTRTSTHGMASARPTDSGRRASWLNTTARSAGTARLASASTCQPSLLPLDGCGLSHMATS